MTSHSKVYPIMGSQGNYIVSVTKAIIKTHVAARRYWDYSKRIIEKATIIIYYTTETISNLTVTSMNFLKAGFRCLYRKFYLTVLTWCIRQTTLH